LAASLLLLEDAEGRPVDKHSLGLPQAGDEGPPHRPVRKGPPVASAPVSPGHLGPFPAITREYTYVQ
jgi:hypothetical protein